MSRANNTGSSPVSTVDMALRYAAAGLSVLPVAADGTKRPANVRSWSPLQQQIPSEAEIRRMFRGEVGIGIICGRVSGNLETLDVDAPELVEPFEAAVRETLPDLLEQFPIVATPRNDWGGRHYRYRLETDVPPNTILARSELRPRLDEHGAPIIDKRSGMPRLAPITLIETRGEGGYAIAPGSPPTCHSCGLPYKQVSGPPLTELPTIGADTHRTLLRIALSFNRFIDPHDVKSTPFQASDGNRPGDAYDASTAWEEILVPFNWTKVRTFAEITFWRRPGKSSGVSATTGVRSARGKELFCVFSTNAFPFDGPSNGRVCATYSKFGAYAVLNHSGNHAEAATALRDRGFGANNSTAVGESAAIVSGRPRKTVATVLVEEVLNCGVELWHTARSDCFASVPVGEHREHLRVGSRSFRNWMARLSYEKLNRAPSGAVLSEANTLLEGRAAFDGDEHESHIRIAGHSGSIYLDLCDSRWRAVEISSAGWRVVDDPPVRFRRAKAMLPLPEPLSGGTIDVLRRFIAVSDDDWILIIGWLVNTVRPRGPYPLAVLQGEQGCGKSTRARMLRELIDPNSSPLRAEPRDPRDLMIAANNGWIVAFDNLSSIPVWLSDALCRLSTGGGFSTRTLFENDEETIFDAMRPIIVTGIEDVVTRGDLIDRSFLLSLPMISERDRLAESRLWKEFNGMKAQLLGALLDAVAVALREEPRVMLPTLPRMADAAIWATAAESGLSWESGAFIRAYTGNRSAANDLALESSPVAPHVRALAESGGWSGRASELLAKIEEMATDATKRSKAWPTAGNVLSGRLKRLAPNLRAAGVEVTIERDRRGSVVRIRKSPENIVTSVTTVTAPEITGDSSNSRDDDDDRRSPDNFGSSRGSGCFPDIPDRGDAGDASDDEILISSQPLSQHY